MISRIWIDEGIGVTLSEGQSLLLSQNIKNKSVTQINYYNTPAQCGVLPDWLMLPKVESQITIAHGRDIEICGAPKEWLW